MSDATADRAPWLREPEEHRAAYHAFTHYRDMGPGRTMDGAFRLHRVQCRKKPKDDRAEAPGLWREWKKAHRWAERCDAFDSAEEEATRLKRLKAIDDMNQRHAALAVAFQNRVIDRLQQFVKVNPQTGETTVDLSELDPHALVKWLNVATTVERRARGEATELLKVKAEHSGTVEQTHGFSARVMGDPAGVRAATALLAVLSGTAVAPGDAGGDGVAGEQRPVDPGEAPPGSQ